MKTLILKCHPSSIHFSQNSHLPEISCLETKHALSNAAHHLTKLRKPVAFPTETVYGLGAMALDPEAAIQIFQVKNRPPDNPLIVHVSSLSMLHRILPSNYSLPPTYPLLMDAFWPGPLTLLFPANHDIVPPLVTANHPTVAVRIPSHPVARALIAIADTPLAAPSANSSGRPSPTKVEHVKADLEGRLGLILDGGPCQVGLESTVVDGLHQDGNIRILRPGGVTVEDIERVLKQNLTNPPAVLVHHRDYRDQAMEQTPSTPGMKYTHYSPSVPVELIMSTTSAPSPSSAISVLQYSIVLRKRFKHLDRPLKLGILAPQDGNLAMCKFPTQDLEIYKYSLGSVSKPSDIARGLFDGLLSLDLQGVDMILVEEVAETEEGLAVMNRVRKAASSIAWINFSPNN